MSNIWGNNIKLSIFGESHGEAIGIVIDGLQAGIELNLAEIKREMDRRKPGKTNISTSRAEADIPQIISGFFEGKTTGAPLCAIIQNTNTKSADYNKNFMRPGHADYTGYIKYNGFNDYRGGGHFSGRITAPLVFAGSVAKQVLAQKGIVVGAHIKQIETIQDTVFDKVNIDKQTLRTIGTKEFPVLNVKKGQQMQDIIL
jgi:chorismate synthase